MGMVLNWIVQGVMVAAAATVALWVMPAGRARSRVRVWWTVVVTVICLPLVSWLWDTALPAATPDSPGAGSEPLVVVPEAVWTATSLAVSLWIAWIGAQIARLALDLRALARTRRRCRPLATSVEDRLRPSTRARLAKSGARLVASGDVRAAAVLGFGPPVIAVQPALIDQLSDSELDQVMVHEWAHVIRRDALSTLLQRLVHVLAGWHPAVWFAMGRLRMECEMACDEVVVGAIGSAKAYATCLTRVASLAQTTKGSDLAVAMLSYPGLTRRVIRVLALRRTPAFAPQWMLVPAALTIVVALVSGQVTVFGLPLAELAVVEAQAFAFPPSAVPHVAPVATRAAAPATHVEAKPVLSSERSITTDAAPPEAAAVDAPVTSAAPTPAPSAASAPTAAAETTTQPGDVTATPPAAPSLAPPATEVEALPAPGGARTVSAEAKEVWSAATQAGESIGASSRKGAVATAGFFTRLSKKVATSF